MIFPKLLLNPTIGSLPYQDFYMNFFESRNFVLWFQRQRRYFQTQIDKRYFESLTLLSLPGEQSEREIYFTFLRLAVELIKESYAEQFQDLLSLLESILYNNTWPLILVAIFFIYDQNFACYSGLRLRRSGRTRVCLKLTIKIRVGCNDIYRVKAIHSKW